MTYLECYLIMLRMRDAYTHAWYNAHLRFQHFWTPALSSAEFRYESRPVIGDKHEMCTKLLIRRENEGTFLRCITKNTCERNLFLYHVNQRLQSEIGQINARPWKFYFWPFIAPFFFELMFSSGAHDARDTRCLLWELNAKTVNLSVNWSVKITFVAIHITYFWKRDTWYDKEEIIYSRISLYKKYKKRLHVENKKTQKTCH